MGDTSGLIAALNSADPQHGPARTALRHAAIVIVAPLVFVEIEHVTTRNTGRHAALTVHDWLLDAEQDGHVLVPHVDADALRRARRVHNRYTDLRLDFTDAVNVVVAEQFETNDILTLDYRDFRVITPLTSHQAFRLLPDDL